MRISLIKAGEKRENIKTFDLKEGGLLLGGYLTPHS